jgi:hypothetical protein
MKMRANIKSMQKKFIQSNNKRLGLNKNISQILKCVKHFGVIFMRELSQWHRKLNKNKLKVLFIW